MKIARTLLFVCCAAVAATIPVRAQSTPGCGEGSTLKDTYSPQDTQRAEQFLLTLRAAVHANDRKQVAAMVQYPVRVNLPNGTHRQLRTPQQFLAQYDFLFDSNTRDAIDRQVPQCMFARDQGAMIGDGQIWFQDGNGKFLIWSFNHMQ